MRREQGDKGRDFILSRCITGIHPAMLYGETRLATGRPGDIRAVLMAARRRMDDQISRCQPRACRMRLRLMRVAKLVGEGIVGMCRHRVDVRHCGTRCAVLKPPHGVSALNSVRFSFGVVSRDTKRRADPSDDDRLRDALVSLPPTDVRLLVMRHVNQIAPAQISLALGIPERKVKCHLLRALLRLRSVMEHPV